MPYVETKQNDQQEEDEENDYDGYTPAGKLR